MANINLYKIDKNKVRKCIRDLKDTMNCKENVLRFNKKIDEKECEFVVTLYLEEPFQTDKSISWNWILEEFEQPIIQAYKLPRAVVLIEKISDEDECTYAITFGTSFFKVDKYCDRDFGFKFAARIKYSDIKTTTLTSPNFKRSKTVNTYIDYNELDFNSGESFAKLKVNAKLEEGFSLFTPALEIGNSIHFSMKSESIENCIDIINYVEKVLKIPDDKVFYKIPLFHRVKDENMLKILDDKLEEAICKAILHESNDVSIVVPELDIIGVSEVFNRADVRTKLKCSKKEKEISALTIEGIRSFCRDYGINSIEEIKKIKITKYFNDQEGYTDSLKNIIEYTDDENRCIFFSGKWHLFNDDYLTYLNESIEGIKTIYKEKYDFKENVHNLYIEKILKREGKNDKYKGKSEQEIKKSLKKQYYAELCFNLIRADEGEFECYDRDIIKGIEKMDLYEKQTKTMFAVKKGRASSELCYAIDQSLTSLKMYKHGQIEDMPDVENVGLWFILERKEHLTMKNENEVNLCELDMLMLKNRIDQWKKEVMLSGLKPIIYINYRYNG